MKKNNNKKKGGEATPIDSSMETREAPKSHEQAKAHIEANDPTDKEIARAILEKNELRSNKNNKKKKDLKSGDAAGGTA